MTLAACSTSGAVQDTSAEAGTPSSSSIAAATTPPVPDAEGAEPATLPESPAPSSTFSAPASSAPSAPPQPPSHDALAGVLSRDVPQVGDRNLAVVPGAASPPGAGTVRRIRVSVEGGLPVDGQAFASFVLATLNDPRGWTHDGFTFARTDGDFDTEVVLASPDTSREMCRPLETMGTLSCRNGREVVFTWYRWVNGQEDFGGDLTAYRQYLVNHEVGHSLGHGHAACPGAGHVAPVMMQQTKGVKPCLPNPWPYP
jgi:Protein of unknown function (DUF3152)